MSICFMADNSSFAPFDVDFYIVNLFSFFLYFVFVSLVLCCFVSVVFVAFVTLLAVFVYLLASWSYKSYLFHVCARHQRQRKDTRAVA